MFYNTKAFVLAAVAAVAASVAPASAATVIFDYNLSAGGFYTYGEVIKPADEVEFRFTVLEDLSISAFAVAATGTGATAALAADDVSNIRFGFTSPPTAGFTSVETSGTTAADSAFLPGGNYVVGDVFSIYFADGIINDVSLGLSFTTMPPAPVPLPAAGFMLAPVLLAGGAAALRRRKAAKTEA